MPHDHHHAHEDHHGDHHGHQAHGPRPALRWSLLRVSAGQRLGGAAALLGLLWLCVRWALA
ncbi:MAG: hypothetical protein RIQ68_1957 [Pseudomonadota bacterium]|jgi:hypothetical protein